MGKYEVKEVNKDGRVYFTVCCGDTIVSQHKDKEFAEKYADLLGMPPWNHFTVSKKPIRRININMMTNSPVKNMGFYRIELRRVDGYDHKGDMLSTHVEFSSPTLLKLPPDKLEWVNFSFPKERIYSGEYAFIIHKMPLLKGAVWWCLGLFKRKKKNK